MPPTVANAARALARGELVVYPTDTLLGLGASATHRPAVERLVGAKGRSTGQPVSIALSSIEELDAWSEMSAESRAWARRHLPGPYTILVRPSRRARVAFGPTILPARGRLGVRVPDHPVARDLARRAGPITATSANRHGQPACRTAAEARRVFGTTVAVYLSAGPKPSGRPSSLVDLTADHPSPVRRG